MNFLKNLFTRITCKHEDLIFAANIKNDHSIWLCPKCHKLISKPGCYDISKYSDGYHTFEELYHHRAVLFSVICHIYKDRCWKSKKHHDGTMYDGMFIVGIETPFGQATYHYDINPYWDMFDVTELPYAVEWDGHTPEQAIERINLLRSVEDIDVPLKSILMSDPDGFTHSQYDAPVSVNVNPMTYRGYVPSIDYLKKRIELGEIEATAGDVWSIDDELNILVKYIGCGEFVAIPSHK